MEFTENKGLEDWEQRLVDEMKDLKGKMERLSKWLTDYEMETSDDDFDPILATLMKSQLDAMTVYMDCMVARCFHLEIGFVINDIFKED